MLVIPAIDLHKGRCVRLYQGDPERETVYGDDPKEVARQWESLGAKMLHIVDLDGAFSGSAANAAALHGISESITIPFQLGGGIRSREGVEKALTAGAFRVILGTVAVEDSRLTRELATEFAEHLMVGIDAREGKVAIKGWQESSDLKVVELARQVEQWGIKDVIYTDIQRDGTLRGPNLQGLEELLAGTSLRVIVSGGIGSRDDLVALRPYEGRVRGVIVGKALYANRLTLGEAEKALNG